jgi:ribonuclease T
MTDEEVFVSVDVETSGPIPGKYSLLTLGACITRDPEQSFFCRLKPISMEADPDAMKVTGLSLDELAISGTLPKAAMAKFADWVEKQASGTTPVFVGLNAAFDWSFVNYYFHLHLNHNPFGFAPLDIKSMFFGSFASSWRETRSSHMTEVLQPTRLGTHDALADALAQAELFELLRKRSRLQ